MLDKWSEILLAVPKISANTKVTIRMDINLLASLDLLVGCLEKVRCRTPKCATVKSRYIGDGHHTFNRNPYNRYKNPYYWVDFPIPTIGKQWELIDPGTNGGFFHGDESDGTICKNHHLKQIQVNFDLPKKAVPCLMAISNVDSNRPVFFLHSKGQIASNWLLV